MKLSVLIPVYNEKSTIAEVIRRVRAVNLGGLELEIVVADDGSRDGTREVLEQYKGDTVVKTHTSLINLGKGAAVRFALEHATGDIVLIQDADLELDPEDYPKLLAPLVSGEAEVVYGSRFLQKNVMPLQTVLANKFLSTLTTVLFGSRITDMETAYKVFKRDVIKSINLRCVGFEFEPEITSKILLSGRKIKEVAINFHPRTKVEGKKIRFSDGIYAIIYLFKYRFFS
jgi:glycosyltransferase involved in cell wall biosynthesis